MKTCLLLLLSPVILAGAAWRMVKVAFRVGGDLFLDFWDNLP